MDVVGSLAFDGLQEQDWQIVQRDLILPQYHGQMNTITCISVVQNAFTVLSPWELQSLFVL